MFRSFLDNGMRCLVDPSGPADAAGVYLWMNVGSVDEPEGMEGAAHFVEHMVFKGTRSYGVGEVAATIEGLGGDINAWTSNEETVFHATVPSSEAIGAMRVLSEMLRHARFDGEELSRERLVILEEIRGGDDDPDQVLGEALSAHLWPGHPYGRPIIGTTRSVRSMSRDALRGFYRKFYQPANCCLAVVGPVDAEAVLAEARTLFAGGREAPRRELSAPVPGKRPALLRRAFEGARVEIAFPVGGQRHPDGPALDLLAAALGGGASSPLSARLRLKSELCLRASAHHEPLDTGGLFSISLHPREGKAVDAVLAAREEVVRIVSQGPSEEDLERAKVQLLADRAFSREGVDGRAHAACYDQERNGDPDAWRQQDVLLSRLDVPAVTSVARRWLRPEASVQVAMIPKGEGFSPGPWRPAARDVAAHLPMAALAARPPRAAQAHPQPKVTTLPNGLRLVLEPDPGEVVAFRVASLGGALAENGVPGTGAAWARTVMRGAGGLDAVSLAGAVERLGGHLGALVGRSSQAIGAEFPSALAFSGLPHLAAVLLSPTFATEEAERVVGELKEALQEREDRPEQLLHDALWAAANPGHPFGNAPHGTLETLSSLDAGTLRRFHERGLLAGNMVVGVSGGFELARMEEALATAFGGLPSGGGHPWPHAPQRPADTVTWERRLGREQAHVAVVWPGVAVDDPDQPAVEVLAAVLGGQGGRLFGELRERWGLAYAVGAASLEGIHPGIFLCTIATDPARREEAERRLLGEVEKLVATPISEEELSRVKRYLCGGAVLDLQTASARANAAAYAELYGLGAVEYRRHAERVLKVTPEGLLSTARRLLGRPLVVGRVIPE